MPTAIFLAQAVTDSVYPSPPSPASIQQEANGGGSARGKF